MRYALVCLSVLALFVVGCDKKDNTPAAPAAAAPTSPVVVTPTPAPANANVPTTPAAISDAAKASEAQAASTATTEAQSKLDLVAQYIKDKKYDLAQKLLTELDANKSSLPASMQGQIATAQTALTSAKAASAASDATGVKLPSLGN